MSRGTSKGSCAEAVLEAFGRLQAATKGTWYAVLVSELSEAIAADTTMVELRQEVEFLKAENERLRASEGGSVG